MKVIKGIYSDCKGTNAKWFRSSRVTARGVTLAYFCEQSSFCVCVSETKQEKQIEHRVVWNTILF